MKLFKVYTKEKGLIETGSHINPNMHNLTWHREDGPAYIMYYDNGNIKYKEYWFNNILHRLDGPAIIAYDSIINGDILEETYYNKGILHRLDGPAFIMYDNGNIIREEYWLNGNEYTKENYHKALLTLKVQLL